MTLIIHSIFIEDSSFYVLFNDSRLYPQATSIFAICPNQTDWPKDKMHEGNNDSVDGE